MSFIKLYLEDLSIAYACGRNIVPVTDRARRTNRWLKPATGNVKMNVDGGVSRNGARGAAAVICIDEAGAFWELLQLFLMA